MNSEIDPFARRMVFLRVGWMDRYQGLAGGDTITNGGKYVNEHGYGYEIFNYQPFKGKVYGYVAPPRDSPINIDRLGGEPEDESVSEVLAIWVATPPQGGAYIIGWYRNATVFRHYQASPVGSPQRQEDDKFGYYVVARYADATLLPADQRVFPIPQKKGGMGQANIWYANRQEDHREFRLKTLRYIETGEPPKTHKGGTPRPTDPQRRQRVEQAAIDAVIAHFKKLGYQVDSFEPDNVGWDLVATLDRRELKLEVKGLSGSEIMVDLTPNEYAMMKEHRDDYRVCVVSTALTEPKLQIFAYSRESGQWESPDRCVMKFDEIVAARGHTT